MEISRRDFLKLSGGAAGTAVALNFLPDTSLLAAPREFPLQNWVTEKPTICCFCSVGCGAIVHTYADGTIKIEGDPDHPINKGALCPKGQAIVQIHQVNGKPNPQRLTTPLYRKGGTTEWQEKTWEEIIPMIAERIKTTRDEYFITQATNASGATVTVNRCEAIGQFGGGELDNEECYLATKMGRALGLVFMEHCARL